MKAKVGLKVVILRCILYYSGSSGRKGGIHVIITEYSVLCIYTLFKKLEPKNYANFEYFGFCAFFRGFLRLTFVRGISESRHQQI